MIERQGYDWLVSFFYLNRITFSTYSLERSAWPNFLANWPHDFSGSNLTGCGINDAWGKRSHKNKTAHQLERTFVLSLDCKIEFGFPSNFHEMMLATFNSKRLQCSYEISLLINSLFANVTFSNCRYKDGCRRALLNTIVTNILQNKMLPTIPTLKQAQASQ